MTKAQRRFSPNFIRAIELLNKKKAGTDRQVKEPAPGNISQQEQYADNEQ